MKKPFVLLCALLIVLSLSSCAFLKEPAATTPDTTHNTPPTEANQSQTVSDTAVQQISKTRAIEIALQSAGIDRTLAFDVDAELDREHGSTVWEVDFETREYEFSYDVDANTGKILKSDRERND